RLDLSKPTCCGVAFTAYPDGRGVSGHIPEHAAEPAGAETHASQRGARSRQVKEADMGKASLVAICVALLSPGLARAQSYSSRPITFIVPFGAGGPVDTLARNLSEAMRASLGQPVVIENVTGASGTLGVARAARAPPAGCTDSYGDWFPPLLHRSN